ncbi:MAG: hypothetical protein LBG45_03685 [Dysgonamonadaceae bacterium]|nr:hypothetical protein [Dysgonamonadaceae bacterium]
MDYSWVSLLDSVSYFAFYVIYLSGVSLTILLRLWMEDKMQISRLENEHVRLEVDRMKEQIPGFQTSGNDLTYCILPAITFFG